MQFQHLKTWRYSYMPFAFTEHSVTMLASIISSDKAIEMNIAIVRVFISLKQLIIESKSFIEELQNLRKELHQLIDIYNKQLNGIYEAIENLIDDRVTKEAKLKDWEDR